MQPPALSNPPTIAEAFELQAYWCDALGSPFNAGLLRWLAAEWRSGGAIRDRLPSWPGDAARDLLALRVAGALHALALGGRYSVLAAVYPPHANAFDAAEAAGPLRGALVREAAHLNDYLAHPPQTNEVNRSAVLLGGLAMIRQRSALPFAMREIGASAGLNLLWDRYRYALDCDESGGGGSNVIWGRSQSPVRIESRWTGPAPTLPASFAIESRRACDLAPIDLRDPASAVRLESYVWPDQLARLARLRAAVAVARDAFIEADITVEACDAADWVERQLASRPKGAVTVLLHTIVWQYMPAATQERIRASLKAHGETAGADQPLAWLRQEPNGADTPLLSLTWWPGGAEQATEQVLAQTHAHGSWVHWAGSPPA